MRRSADARPQRPPRRWRWVAPLLLALAGAVLGFRHVQATLPFVTLAPVMLALWVALVGAALGAVAGGIAIVRDGPPGSGGDDVGDGDGDASRQALLGLAALLLVVLGVTLTGLSWWAQGTWPAFLR